MDSNAHCQSDRIFSLEVIKMDIFLFLRTFNPSYRVFPLKEENKIKPDFFLTKLKSQVWIILKEQIINSISLKSKESIKTQVGMS